MDIVIVDCDGMCNSNITINKTVFTKLYQMDTSYARIVSKTLLYVLKDWSLPFADNLATNLYETFDR